MEYDDRQQSLVNIGADVELEMFYVFSILAFILLISLICCGIGCIIGYMLTSKWKEKKNNNNEQIQNHHV